MPFLLHSTLHQSRAVSDFAHLTHGRHSIFLEWMTRLAATQSPALHQCSIRWVNCSEILFLNTHWTWGILEVLLGGGLKLRRHTPDYQSACYQQHGEPQTWAPWAWLRHVTFLKSCRRIPQFPQPFFFSYIIWKTSYFYTSLFSPEAPVNLISFSPSAGDIPVHIQKLKSSQRQCPAS